MKQAKIPQGSVLGLSYDGRRDSAVAVAAPDGTLVYACSLERISRKKQDGSWPGILLKEMPLDALSGVALAGEEFLAKEAAAQSFLEALSVPVYWIDPFLCHAQASFWSSGFKEALCLIYKEEGGCFYNASEKDGVKFLETFDFKQEDNLCHYYAGVTESLGYVPYRHEGKVMGLAAFGGAGENPEDRAAAAQVVLEEKIKAHLERARQKGWAGDALCLSGSLFSNVKLNQKIKTFFQNLFVFPAMSADGAAYGAALDVLARRGSLKSVPLSTMALGPSFDEAEIVASLKAAGASYEVLEKEKAAEKIASLLAAQKSVGFFGGPLEFGPRALGQRSILASALNKDIHQTLNEKLHRTSFMPFAPVTRIEDAAFCYTDLEGCLLTAEYMTMTTACAPFMQERCPAAVHVDGTARPQLLRREKNPLLHDILTRFQEKTGSPALINTSFNMHEEPIVCSPSDAMKTFKAARLDALFFSDCLILIRAAS